MNYRTFGKQGYDLSAFGMGCMRLPHEQKADGSMGIDHAESVRMIRRAIELGVNYFDSANTYNDGESEETLGEALAGGYREKVHIGTKISPRLCTSEDAFREVFERECKRLQTDYLDVYLLHNLSGGERWDMVVQNKVLGMMEKLKAEKRIGAMGFSFHDDFDAFKSIIDAYDWDVCYIQFNVLDVDSQATQRGLEYAGKKGVPVVVMEPLRGGGLSHVPAAVQSVYDASPLKRSGAEWCLRFAADFPEVVTVLSGVSTMEQLEDNVRIFSDVAPGKMSADEHAVCARVRQAYESLIAVPCTGCAYCMPCPNGVDIPGTFTHYNNGTMYSDFTVPSAQYSEPVGKGNGADQCIECGLCEPECPQHIAIIDKLKEAHAALTR